MVGESISNIKYFKMLNYTDKIISLTNSERDFGEPRVKGTECVFLTYIESADVIVYGLKGECFDVKASGNFTISNSLKQVLDEEIKETNESTIN